jgi:hypothetical protein
MEQRGVEFTNRIRMQSTKHIYRIATQAANEHCGNGLSLWLNTCELGNARKGSPFEFRNLIRLSDSFTRLWIKLHGNASLARHQPFSTKFSDGTYGRSMVKCTNSDNAGRIEISTLRRLADALDYNRPG